MCRARKSLAVGFGSACGRPAAAMALYTGWTPTEGIASACRSSLGDGASAVGRRRRQPLESGWQTLGNKQTSSGSIPTSTQSTGRSGSGLKPRSIAAGEGSIWVTNIDDASVSRIDPAQVERVGSPIEVGQLPNNITVGEGAAWVSSGVDGSRL